MEEVIDGYGALSDEMAFRTAIYVGVHLISWYNRRPLPGPRVAPPEVIVAGLTVGRDFMVKGWEKDRAFFQGSALASLFSCKIDQDQGNPRLISAFESEPTITCNNDKSFAV